MAYKHLCLLYRHHLHWNGSRILPYFYFNNMKFVAERIKIIAKSSMDNIKVNMKKVKAAKKKSLEVEKNGKPDLSVQIAEV